MSVRRAVAEAPIAFIGHQGSYKIEYGSHREFQVQKNHDLVMCPLNPGDVWLLQVRPINPIHWV